MGIRSITKANKKIKHDQGTLKSFLEKQKKKRSFCGQTHDGRVGSSCRLTKQKKRKDEKV